MKQIILEGDALELLKKQKDNTVDLIITSPPYSDIINYGSKIDVKDPVEYINWIIPILKEVSRVLKESGSLIFNINDFCKKGVRSTYIYELIYKNTIENPTLKLYDTYFWHKKNGIPNGSKKRFRNKTEFIFHFVKNPKKMKFYMDRVMEEPSENYLNRIQYPVNDESNIEEGVRLRKKAIWIRQGKKRTNNMGSSNDKYDLRVIPDKVRPDNVFRFKTAASSRDNEIRHPAPFHKELPEYFINLLSDEGDLIMDIFSGIGTVGLVCKEMNRNHIGYELNPEYVEFSRKKLQEKLF